ncbi:MAG TPA: hypothetical protein DCS12_04180 [Clostridiales bacterium]|nr:hypothetical protein [Clostridiales bacterium]
MTEKTIVSLSFDDGREDTYRMAFKIMKEFNLVGTIHVTTGYVDKTWENNSWQTAKGPMTIKQLKELSDNGFEISSHGDKHITNKDDLLISIKKMHEWNVIGDKVGFSIPCSRLSESDKILYAKYLKTTNVVYMRGGRSKHCYSFLSKAWYVLYNATKLTLFYQLFNRYNCINPNDCRFNPYNLQSVVIRSGDKANVITEFIKGNEGSWIIFMLHGIQNNNEDTYGKDPWCWDAIEFEKLCANLRELVEKGEVRVQPILEVILAH